MFSSRVQWKLYLRLVCLLIKRETNWIVSSQSVPFVVHVCSWCPMTPVHAAGLKILCGCVWLVQSVVCLCLCGPLGLPTTALLFKTRDPPCVSIERRMIRDRDGSLVLVTPVRPSDINLAKFTCDICVFWQQVELEQQWCNDATRTDSFYQSQV